LNQYPQIHVSFDGADEVDAQLNCIKGGGGCHVQEKLVAASSNTLVIVADYRKKSKTLGKEWKKGVPVEVLPMAYVPVLEVIHLSLTHRNSNFWDVTLSFACRLQRLDRQ
jgi:ribose 5-phosphate isomerase A